MATVYLARDLRHRRPVALKVLHPELAYAVGADRFLREIEVAANLTHPHILPLFDSGEVDGLLYYVMPYIEGESLRDRLTREKQLSLEEALRITREVGDALTYAHAHSVIHRDIKPENILLSGGHAFVADFGIARAIGQAASDGLTETGLAVGTAAYMSPEQASGERQLDARADLYSLGCVLYEMLAGEPPHTGPTPQAIIARALTELPRPIHPMRPGVSEGLDAAIRRAMAIAPADRFPGVSQFVAAAEASPHLSGSRADTETTGASRGMKGGKHRGSTILATLGRRPLFTVLILGVLLGAGALFAWRGSHGGGESGHVKRLAVLPFENLGDSADAYFADGMTDAVRGKLSELPGLQVTARSSASQYRNTSKTPQQIGQELGVDYLLTATIRWEKAAGTSRVQVTPELVQVHSASTKWQQPFDAALTSVFEVQAEMASRVAQALDVALGDRARQQLAERPTQSLAAYDAYLKGEEGSPTLFYQNPAILRRAVTYYAQAVALDSTFALAWAQLSRAHSILYYNSTPTPAEAELARRAAERAAALAPDRTEGHLAMGSYYFAVVKDNAGAAEEFRRGQKVAPNDANLLASLALTEQALGRWEAALADLQQARTLDPRSVGTALYLAQALLWLRRYPEAREAADHALALAPTDPATIEQECMVFLAQGDLTGARAVVANVPKEVDLAALVAHFANYFDLYWMLDEAQQVLLLGMSPSEFDDDRAVWGLVLAQTYALRGDHVRARSYADSARNAFEQHLRATPEDAQQHVQLGLTLAYLGRKTEAIHEGQRGVALLPIAKDANFGYYIQQQLGRIYMLAGEPEKALDQLEPLLRIPYFLSPGWLKLDPSFDPLRGNPRFQKLVGGT